jgi:hypothetical protein
MGADIRWCIKSNVIELDGQEGTKKGAVTDSAVSSSYCQCLVV